MARELPATPDLEYLRKQAKELLRDLESREPAAVQRLASLGNLGHAAKLADAQLVIAREYGFPSWAKLKAHVESTRDDGDPARAAVAAIRAGDAAALERLLARHAALRKRIDEPLPEFGFDYTAIVGAAERGSRALVDVLLDAGADIDGRSHWWAGSFGVLDLCPPAFAPYLLQRGATLTANAAARLDMRDALADLVRGDPELVHARGGDGQTPLHVAASVEVARLLVEHGADIDALDVDHESTPAQYAIGERPEVARYLVERGCKTDILLVSALGDIARVREHLERDPSSIRMSVTARYFPMKNPRAGGTIYIWTLGGNMTPHGAARRFGHDDVFDLLMQHTPATLKFAIAGELGDAALMRSLLGQDPDLPHHLGEDERARLVAAAQHDDLAAVRTMLEAGWPVDPRGQHGATPLHWAAWHGDLEMVREILRYNPPLEAREHDFNGTALDWAVYASVNGSHPDRGDYAGTVETLLAAGARISDEPRYSEKASAAVRAVIAAHRARDA
jgi:ankyrin repeat protein